MEDSRTFRIGIDVGGTFTKAVLIDNATFEVVDRYSVMTTHSDWRGGQGCDRSVPHRARALARRSQARGVPRP
ncbi:MAG: hypothetical protein KIS79_00010 [Burkholderiales bacterium]|nr:hypothetical protein [Burkholderiales bacterium]